MASNDQIRDRPRCSLAPGPVGNQDPCKASVAGPTLIRSQLLAHLYGLVRRGELDGQSAERQLDYLRRLRLRQLGDRILQRLAWKIAAQLGWHDTFIAEYIALTQLQADALVCIDPDVSRAATSMVKVVSIDELLEACA